MKGDDARETDHRNCMIKVLEQQEAPEVDEVERDIFIKQRKPTIYSDKRIILMIRSRLFRLDVIYINSRICTKLIVSFL